MVPGNSGTALLHAFDRQILSARIGPFTVVELDIGWSPTVVGRLYGRLRLPVPIPGYLWASVRVFNWRAINGSYQLS
jgi:hypothetical protein